MVYKEKFGLWIKGILCPQHAISHGNNRFRNTFVPMKCPHIGWKPTPFPVCYSGAVKGLFKGKIFCMIVQGVSPSLHNLFYHRNRAVQ